MSKWFTLFLVLIVSSRLSAQQVFVSLDQYIDYAIQHNPAIQQAMLNEKVEQQNYHTAISPLLPVAKAQASINDNLILNTQLIPAEIFGGTPGTFKEIKFGTKYSINPNGDVSLNLTNAANYQNLAIAKKNQSVANANTQLTIEQIKTSLAQAYYIYLLYQRNDEFANKNFNNADSLLKIIQVRYDNQSIDELDLNRSKSTRLQAQNQSDQSQIALQKAMNTLKLLAGMNMTDRLVVQDKLVMPELPLAEVINSNLYSRPAVRASYLRADISQMTIERERLRFVPDLLAFANYGLSGQNNNFKFSDATQKWYQNSAVGLTLNVPVFNGGIKYFNLQKAKINQQIAALDLQNTQLKTSKEDQDLLLDYTKAKKDVAVRQQQLSFADRNYTLALVKYKNEALAYDNVVNIQNEQLTAQQQLLQAEADFVTLQYRIKLLNSYDKK